MPGPYPGYFPLWPIRVGSAQKGYFFKLKVYERDLVGREVGHCSL